eukprot:CAMPEP_0204578536 /NCGR_PEP_ID=MMETSP0661-20131031/42982_1 /ASSEMBLY_ACC=CAM_ASM_000606 /TAXON_ID=109239 /ORGANISM="Alexandrium margalefi, Strain AMGDE01CS-322" /LENGTH=220 /DNA_ID=CAMNT_0051587471 /DNA_START=72 /DNA_END=734 /DNA_ORIENTATION=-
MFTLFVLCSHVLLGVSTSGQVPCADNSHLLFVENPTEDDIEKATACLMEPIKQSLGFVGDLAVIGGGVGGTAIGAKAGAFVGALVGPIGAMAGGIVGGIAGFGLGVDTGGMGEAALLKAAEVLHRALAAFLKWLLVSGDEEFCRSLQTLELDCADRPPCTIVRSAWKALVFRHHPDRRPHASREEKADMQLYVTKLNLAWEVALHRFGGLASCRDHGDDL